MVSRLPPLEESGKKKCRPLTFCVFDWVARIGALNRATRNWIDGKPAAWWRAQYILSFPQFDADQAAALCAADDADGDDDEDDGDGGCSETSDEASSEAGQACM